MENRSAATDAAVGSSKSFSTLLPTPDFNKASGANREEPGVYVHPMQRSLTPEEASCMLFDSECVLPAGETARAELFALSRESNLAAWEAVSGDMGCLKRSASVQELEEQPSCGANGDPAASVGTKTDSTELQTYVCPLPGDCGELREYKQRLIEAGRRFGRLEYFPGDVDFLSGALVPESSRRQASMQSDGAAPATLPPTSRTAAHAWGLNRRQPKRLTVSACQMLKQQSGMLSAMRVQCMEGEKNVLELLQNLDIDPGAKALRDKSLLKKLRVPRPPPPPLVPWRFGRSTKIRCRSDEEEHFAKCLLSKGSGDEELIDKFNISITRQALRCLSGTNWLNDEVINFYLNMLNERNQRQLANGERIWKCYFFSTFFYSKLGRGSQYNYDGVRRWTKRQKVDIFDMDLLFVPIHAYGLHWALGVVDMRDKLRSIRFFDSLGGFEKTFAPTMKRFLEDEHMDKKGSPMPWDKEDWFSEPDGKTEDGTPQQLNNCDCGVFLCQTAECISDGRALDFSQDDIPNIRLKMRIPPLGSELRFQNRRERSSREGSVLD